MKNWLSLLAVLSLCISTPLFAKTSSAGQESDKQADIARSHYNCEGELSTADEIQYCASQSTKKMNAQLNKVYSKVYRQTAAKAELEKAQKAWIKYRDLQCYTYVNADTHMSPASMSINEMCASQLTEQRIEALKALLY